jgi:hypothetical protein
MGEGTMPPYRAIARYAYPGYWNLQAECCLRIWAARPRHRGDGQRA